MDYQFITSNRALADFCNRARQADAIAVDTEFVRTRTLRPKLGLIQLYDGQSLVLVDPVSIDDFAPLKVLLTAPGVTKVLHACSEDLETFWCAIGVIPAPVFDTQFAASILNMGTNLGYANLVEKMLEISLDKGESRTDWLARPLREEQCHYAANDVLYLWQLYPQLYQAVSDKGCLDWVYDEVRNLAKKKCVCLPAEYAYLGIKNNWQLRGQALYLLKSLAAWRLDQARERDLALNFVLKETSLIDIVKRKPDHKGALFQIPDIMPQQARLSGEQILNLVQEAKSVPPEMYPPVVERLTEYPGFKKVSSALRALCLQVAEKLQVPVEVIGSKKQIQQLLKWLWFDLDETRQLGLQPDLISTWRRPFLQHGIEDITGYKLEK